MRRCSVSPVNHRPLGLITSAAGKGERGRRVEEEEEEEEGRRLLLPDDVLTLAAFGTVGLESFGAVITA